MSAQCAHCKQFATSLPASHGGAVGLMQMLPLGFGVCKNDALGHYKAIGKPACDKFAKASKAVTQQRREDIQAAYDKMHNGE